jgi:large subunit ribosomal protein L10
MREIKPCARNLEQVARLKEKLTNAQGIYLTDFSGLTVAEMTELRKRLRQAKVEYLVIKNTLSRVAFREQGYEGLVVSLDGPNAIAIGYDDPTIPAKVISSFAREFNKPTIRSCVFDGEIYIGADAEKAKDFPSKQQIRSQVIGTIVAPLSGFIGVISQAMSDFLAVLDAYIQKRQEEEKQE